MAGGGRRSLAALAGIRGMLRAGFGDPRAELRTCSLRPPLPCSGESVRRLGPPAPTELLCSQNCYSIGEDEQTNLSTRIRYVVRSFIQTEFIRMLAPFQSKKM